METKRKGRPEGRPEGEHDMPMLSVADKTNAAVQITVAAIQAGAVHMNSANPKANADSVAQLYAAVVEAVAKAAE